jgi:RHS repeat-associated protein
MRMTGLRLGEKLTSRRTATASRGVAVLNDPVGLIPYGAPRGQQVAWADNRGFLNKPADPSTGLTVLGARQYDPVTGQFVSPDPVLVPSDPQGLDLYSYAGDDPVSSADGSGLCPVDRSGFGIVNNGTVYRHGPVDPGDPSSPYIPSTCSGCGSYPVASAPPLTPYQVGVELGAQPAGPHPPTISDLTYMKRVLGYRGSDGFTLTDMAAWLPGAASSGLRADGAWDEFCQGIEGAPLSACGTNPFNGDHIYDSGFSGFFSWRGLVAMAGIAFAVGSAFAPAIGGPQIGGLDDLAIGGLDGGLLGLESAGEGTAASCGLSFTATTKILLASGKSKPLSQLKPGDKVLATSTQTGRTRAETVGAVLVNHDTDLYDLKIKAGNKTAVIHTTTNHPFWIPGAGSSSRWIKARELRYGTHLRTPSGGAAVVMGGWKPKLTSGWMWDLTILGDHDFYVQAAGTAILVHNCPVLLGTKADIEGYIAGKPAGKFDADFLNIRGTMAGERRCRWLELDP